MSAFGEPKPDSRTLIEIRESAERLALELDEFLNKNEIPTKGLLKGLTEKGKPDFSGMTDEAIADLQLATARKLREVRLPIVQQGTHSTGSRHQFEKC